MITNNEPICRECGTDPAGPSGLCVECQIETRPTPKTLVLPSVPYRVRPSLLRHQSNHAIVLDASGQIIAETCSADLALVIAAIPDLLRAAAMLEYQWLNAEQMENPEQVEALVRATQHLSKLTLGS